MQDHNWPNFDYRRVGKAARLRGVPTIQDAAYGELDGGHHQRVYARLQRAPAQEGRFAHPTVRKRRRRGQRHGERGFTLVEILVVITIIGLIMGLVGPRVLNYLGESKTKAAKIQIESFSSALDLFFLDNGRYPTTSEGLTALVQRN